MASNSRLHISRDAILVRFCMERVARERIKGFLMAPWAHSYGEEGRKKLLEACDLVENARRVWYNSHLEGE